MSLHLSKSKCCIQNAVAQKEQARGIRPIRDEPKTILETGNLVGDLAMGLFGAYTEIPYGDLSDMITQTEELMDAGTPIIAEASFSYHGCFCSCDILKNPGQKQVELYEVKSSTPAEQLLVFEEESLGFSCYSEIVQSFFLASNKRKMLAGYFPEGENKAQYFCDKMDETKTIQIKPKDKLITIAYRDKNVAASGEDQQT